MSGGISWQSRASVDTLKKRAELLARIRAFFAARGVLEVETPLLCDATALDPNLSSFTVAETNHYLQTSPEFAMKRLLAGGSGPIFQICKAFRQGEEGRRHNPEFTMLEWYRPGYSLTDLVTEVSELVSPLFGNRKSEVISYRDVFRRYAGVDPFSTPQTALEAMARDRCGYASRGSSKDQLLELVMSHLVEPHLGQDTLTCVIDFPASQAALAKVATDRHGDAVACRFEFYVEGVELANGYHELGDAAELAQRFDKDMAARKHRSLPRYPKPTRLLAALPSMPDCSGVALGVDRLLMLSEKLEKIEDALAFPFSEA